jgi:hypothetical protein
MLLNFYVAWDVAVAQWQNTQLHVMRLGFESSQPPPGFRRISREKDLYL